MVQQLSDSALDGPRACFPTAYCLSLPSRFRSTLDEIYVGTRFEEARLEFLDALRCKVGRDLARLKLASESQTCLKPTERRIKPNNLVFLFYLLRR